MELLNIPIKVNGVSKAYHNEVNSMIDAINNLLYESNADTYIDPEPVLSLNRGDKWFAADIISFRATINSIATTTGIGTLPVDTLTDDVTIYNDEPYNLMTAKVDEFITYRNEHVLGAPLNFVATPQNNSIALVWDAPFNDPGTAMNYIVKRDGTVVYEGSAENYTITGLTNGQSYDVRVTAQTLLYTPSIAASATVIPAAGSATGYYYLQSTDTVRSESFMVANGTPFNISSGSNYTLTIPSSGPQWYIIQEPISEPEKQSVQLPDGYSDPIGGDGVFSAFTVSGSRQYRTKYETELPTLIFKQ